VEDARARSPPHSLLGGAGGSDRRAFVDRGRDLARAGVEESPASSREAAEPGWGKAEGQEAPPKEGGGGERKATGKSPQESSRTGWQGEEKENDAGAGNKPMSPEEEKEKEGEEDEEEETTAGEEGGPDDEDELPGEECEEEEEEEDEEEEAPEAGLESDEEVYEFGDDLQEPPDKAAETGEKDLPDFADEVLGGTGSGPGSKKNSGASSAGAAGDAQSNKILLLAIDLYRVDVKAEDPEVFDGMLPDVEFSHAAVMFGELEEKQADAYLKRAKATADKDASSPVEGLAGGSGSSGSNSSSSGSNSNNSSSSSSSSSGSSGSSSSASTGTASRSSSSRRKSGSSSSTGSSSSSSSSSSSGGGPSPAAASTQDDDDPAGWSRERVIAARKTVDVPVHTAGGSVTWSESRRVWVAYHSGVQKPGRVVETCRLQCTTPCRIAKHKPEHHLNSCLRPMLVAKYRMAKALKIRDETGEWPELKSLYV
jgi:hypothetical protein